MIFQFLSDLRNFYWNFERKQLSREREKKGTTRKVSRERDKITAKTERTLLAGTRTKQASEKKRILRLFWEEKHKNPANNGWNSIAWSSPLSAFQVKRGISVCDARRFGRMAQYSLSRIADQCGQLYGSFRHWSRSLQGKLKLISFFKTLFMSRRRWDSSHVCIFVF